MTSMIPSEPTTVIIPNPFPPVQIVQQREINRVAFPTQEEWTRLQAYAKLAVSAKINKTIENEAQAMVVALKGWHLGIDPMEAFQQIVIIDNKTTIQVQLMIALANRSGKLLKFEIPDPSKAFEEKKATAIVVRKDRPDDIIQATFTMEDAQRANLVGKFIWKQYPGQMLVNRAVAIALRRAIPEDLGLMHATEEIDPEEKPSQPAKPALTITAPAVDALPAGEPIQSDALPAQEDQPPWWTNASTIAELVNRAISKGFIEKGQGAADLLKLVGTQDWKGFASSKDAGLAILAAVEKLKASAPAQTNAAPAGTTSEDDPIASDELREIVVNGATYDGRKITFQTPTLDKPLSVFSRNNLAVMAGDFWAGASKVKEWTGTAQEPKTYRFESLTVYYGVTKSGNYKVIKAEAEIPF